ncbi:hypothetical protein ASF30_08975 [Leifsonia sp. Leaf264]|nr:hypothetical protein ASF30_08975 [Leifsonia sp. Leaf264]
MMRSIRGAIDLGSIMVGVIVIAIFAGIISVSVFAVIPWSQDEAAKQNLMSVADAEAVARTGFADGAPAAYLNSAGLDGAELLDADPDANLVVGTDATGSCWVALSRSGSGDPFFASSKHPKPVGYDTQNECVDVPALFATLHDPNPPVPLVASYADVTFDRSGGGSVAPTVTGPAGAKTFTSTDLPDGVNLNPTTGEITGPPAWRFNAKKVAVGGMHTCAITLTGTVKCWGYNLFGQLGSGITSYMEPLPVDVVGLTDVKDIYLGGMTTCALTSTNGLKCWGLNSDGAVGDGTRINRDLPTDVIGLTSGVKTASFSDSHICAVTTAGALFCWGNGDYGQIGNDDTRRSVTPTPVHNLGSGVSSVAVGGTQSCAVTDAGAALCWGAGNSGQLGDGTTWGRLEPNPVLGLSSGVAEIRAGANFTCARMDTGTVKCWGNNVYGALGDGTTDNKYAPTDVPGLANVASLAGTGASMCAVTTGKDLYCWGGNDIGQVGTGSADASVLTPTLISSNVTTASIGSQHNCAAIDTELECWGAGTIGQLGTQPYADHLAPVDVYRAGFDQTATVTVKSGGQTVQATLRLKLS